MSKMKSAWLVEPGSIEIRSVDKPALDPDGVLVRVEAALTCGTDLKAFHRGHRLIPMPGPFGHEYAGIVEAVGPEVEAFRPGDAVMGVHSAPCGRCYWCARDEGNLCQDIMETKVLGSYAEYLHVPGRIARVNLFHKPERLSFTEAALLEPLACVVHGLSRLQVRPDDAVVIVGPGPIGLLHLAVLRARGCKNVIVLGRRPYRLERAKVMGASAVYDVRVRAARDVVQDETDGRGADVVIECTGQEHVWEEATWMCRRGGHVVLFGGLPGGTRVAFDAARIHYDQITLHSPFHFTPAAVRDARGLMLAGLDGLAELISDSVPLTEVPSVFAGLSAGEGLKVAILPWADALSGASGRAV